MSVQLAFNTVLVTQLLRLHFERKPVSNILAEQVKKEVKETICLFNSVIKLFQKFGIFPDESKRTP